MADAKTDCTDLIGKPKKKPTGRPSTFTQDVADKICERLIEARSLRSICQDDDMPSVTTVMKWLTQFPAFAEQYTRARELQADAIFDEILDIADDGSNDWMVARDKDGQTGWKENGEALQRSRLRIDSRKWMAGKLRPKKYSDKTLIGSDPDNPLPEHTVKIDVAGIADQLRRQKALPPVIEQDDD